MMIYINRSKLIFATFLFLSIFIWFFHRPNFIDYFGTDTAKAQTGYDDWAQCVGAPLTQFMEELCAIGLPGNVSLLSFTFNVSSPTFGPLVGAVTIPSCIRGISGNIYNHPGTLTINQQVQSVKSAFGRPIYIVESGTFTHSQPALDMLRDEISILDGSVQSLALFNAFGSNGSYGNHVFDDGQIRHICGGGNCSKRIGVNSASSFDQPDNYYSRGGGLGMGWNGEIGNGGQATSAANGIIKANNAGLTTIIRLGVGTNSLGLGTPQAILEFARQINANGASGINYYIIAGPNEPDLEPWLTPACGDAYGNIPGQNGTGTYYPGDPSAQCSATHIYPARDTWPYPLGQCLIPGSLEMAPGSTVDADDCNPEQFPSAPGTDWTACIPGDTSDSNICHALAENGACQIDTDGDGDASTGPQEAGCAVANACLPAVNGCCDTVTGTSPANLGGAGDEFANQICRKQVASQNFSGFPATSCLGVKDVDTCNEILSRPADKRSTDSQLTSCPGCPGASAVSYIRKLNQCQEFKGYVHGPGSGDLGERAAACNTIDGERCVDGNIDVCRKAIRVETFETRHRTNTPPPASAFTSACILRRIPGQNFSCGHGLNCDYGCLDSCTPGPADPSCPPDGCRGGEGYRACNNVAETMSSTYPWAEAASCGGGTSNLCSANGASGCYGSAGCCYTQDLYADFSPMPADAEYCSRWEWSERAAIYTVVYGSNRVDANMHLSNWSDHELEDVNVSVQVPDFLDFDEDGSWDQLPDSYKDNDADPDNDCGNDWCIQRTDLTSSGGLTCNAGALVSWNLRRFPSRQLGAGSINLPLILTPSIIDSGGGRHCGDVHITDLAELPYYIDSLPSDDRLVNLEVVAKNASMRSVELMSFWIGKGVVSNLSPGCGNGADCTVDPDLEPFGWPTKGKVAQDWGGSFDICHPYMTDLEPKGVRVYEDPGRWSTTDFPTEEHCVWVNPIPDRLAEQQRINSPGWTYPNPYPAGATDGVYKECWPGWAVGGGYTDFDVRDRAGLGDTYQADLGLGGWMRAGIDLAPNDDQSSPPEVYTTQSGYVTHIGYNPQYPGRGYYIIVANTIDDDHLFEIRTLYANLIPGSERVEVGNYAPRHKLLGLMGQSGSYGDPRVRNQASPPPASIQLNRVHTHYSMAWLYTEYTALSDVNDNNCGPNDPWCVSADPDAPMDPPDHCMTDWINPWELASAQGDTCNADPYICRAPDPYKFFDCLPPYQNDIEAQSRFFCSNRFETDEVNACFYDNVFVR